MAKLYINYRIIVFFHIIIYIFFTLLSNCDYSGRIGSLDGFLLLCLCVANGKQRWEKGALGSCIGAGEKQKKDGLWCVVRCGTDPRCQIHCRSIPIRRGEVERARPGKQI